MKKLITYDQEKNIFILTNNRISYIIEILEDTYLAHRYFGKKIVNYNFSNRSILKKRTFAATPYIDKPEFSLEFIPLEIPFSHQGDYRNSAVQIENKDKQRIARFSYKSYEIKNRALELRELPHARNTTGNAQTLILRLYDDTAKLELDLFYTIFDDSSVIVRSTKIRNNSPFQIKIDKLLSASIDIQYKDHLLTTFHGTHQKEYQLSQNKIQHGLFKIGSSRGFSGPQYPPFIAVSKTNDEFQGEVQSMSMLYSGNHEAIIERDQYNNLRMQIGLNSDTFTWTLNSKEEFQSPQALLIYSDCGFNGHSQVLHEFLNKHIINPEWNNKKRPIIINSWEMSYFNVNYNLMKELIDSASLLGFETVVLDDGWYGKRNNSKTSLGDWIIDTEKFPEGISPLVEYARQKNMGFGLWFEPEMISPNTQLIEKHPDWVMKSKSYEPILGRSQYILDLTNIEVQQFIIDTLDTAITNFGINYVKWDMNRHMTDPFSQTYSGGNSLEYSHRYILGLYHILNELTKKYPNVLFENCSSGGGRLDLGMLFYFPQTWISDNTDGLDRQQIQYGASYLFPISSITGHVSTSPNHQTNRRTPFKTRASLASSTNMGYEMDIIHMNNEEKEVVSNHINQYKNERELVLKGQFYRLKSPFNTNLCSWMFTDKERNKIILYVFRNIYHPYDLSLLIPIPYIDVNAFYKDEQTEKIFSGSELANAGLSFANPEGDFITHKVTLNKIKHQELKNLRE